VSDICGVIVQFGDDLTAVGIDDEKGSRTPETRIEQ
jgi:hypothetical protein